MIDFTLGAYLGYLEALLGSQTAILRFDEYLLGIDRPPPRFCLLRHDVDRKERNALTMARAENAAGVQATYYFRCRRRPLNGELIREIAALGHEVGYHYENLSDAAGDVDAALEEFEGNLERLRQWVPVQTIAMHGRPFRAIDNRDLWRPPERRELLRNKFGILGEVYLDIDYHDIAYICDTGRNWNGTRDNRQDHVTSTVDVDLKDGVELRRALQENRFPKLVLQVHPERWAGSAIDFAYQYVFDTAVNLVKRVL